MKTNKNKLSININYEKVFESTIKEILSQNKKPTLLLHVCCAPCSTACIKVLQKYFEITLLYYNPNITDENEFEKRYFELDKYIKIKNNEFDLLNKNCNDKTNIFDFISDIKVVKLAYNPQEYFDAVKGFENEKEGGTRCEKCFILRLSKSAEYALNNNFDYFTTTLTLSPYKNSQLLNTLGEEISKKYNVKYLFSDFKKNNGNEVSKEESKKYDLYRQDYCGCIFSKNERDKKLSEKQ